MNVNIYLQRREILCDIADILDNVQEVNALVRTSRYLYKRLNRYLYRFDMQHHYSQDDRRLYDYTWPHVRQISSKELSDKQDRIDADAALYIGTQDNVDGNALYFAIRWNHIRTAEVLIQLGSARKPQATPDPNSLGFSRGVRSAEYYERWEYVERIFADGLNALQTALVYGRGAVVRMLIDHGADFRRSVWGNAEFQDSTPLHIACWHGDATEIVKLLLECGADTESQTDRLETPLFWAVGRWERFPTVRPRDPDAMWKIVELLLDHGADPQVVSADQRRFNCAENTRCWKSDTAGLSYDDPIVMARYLKLECPSGREW